MQKIPLLGIEVAEVAADTFATLKDNRWNEAIYSIFGHGRLTPEIVESLMKKLENIEDHNL